MTVRVDDKYNVNLQLVEATGRILCFVEVVQLPKDASKEIYRDLLAGSLFGKDTAGSYFTLVAESETVVYNYFFDLDTAAKDVDDFVSTIEKILQLCDSWCERIDAKKRGGARCFNSRPSCDGRPGKCRFSTGGADVSIHARRATGDLTWRGEELAWDVSIHARRATGDWHRFGQLRR